MSASYDKSGIRFLYPENWQVTDEETDSWPRTVSVQSPTGGFWSLMVYGSDEDPADLTDKVLSTMREEYDSLEASQCNESFEEIDTAGYDMYFYCLDFVINSRALGTRTGNRTLLMIWQAEDRDFQQLEPVFRAITISLLRRPPATPGGG